MFLGISTVLPTSLPKYQLIYFLKITNILWNLHLVSVRISNNRMSPQQHKTEHATVTVFLSPLHVHSVIARDFRHNIAPCWLIRWKILQDVLLVATVDWFQMYNFDNLNKTYDLLFQKLWLFCLSKDYVESHLLKYIHFCH